MLISEIKKVSSCGEKIVSLVRDLGLEDLRQRMVEMRADVTNKVFLHGLHDQFGEIQNALRSFTPFASEHESRSLIELHGRIREVLIEVKPIVAELMGLESCEKEKELAAQILENLENLKDVLIDLSFARNASVTVGKIDQCVELMNVAKIFRERLETVNYVVSLLEEGKSIPEGYREFTVKLGTDAQPTMDDILKSLLFMRELYRHVAFSQGVDVEENQLLVSSLEIGSFEFKILALEKVIEEIGKIFLRRRAVSLDDWGAALEKEMAVNQALAEGKISQDSAAFYTSGIRSVMAPFLHYNVSIDDISLEYQGFVPQQAALPEPEPVRLLTDGGVTSSVPEAPSEPTEDVSPDLSILEGESLEG